MINVNFERFKGFRDTSKITCNACSSSIEKEQPYFELYLDGIGQTIKICEDCGNNLQNDMSDEYCKFVDLGL